MSKVVKNDNQALMPRLRFPEFQDTGEWKSIPLRNLAKRCIEKNRNGNLTKVLTNSAEYGVVDQRAYFDKDIAVQGKLESYLVAEKGDFVYNPRISAMAPVGPISRNNIATGVMSPLYTVFRFKKENSDFYAHYFKSAGWHEYMRRISSTGARHDRMAISNDDFMSMPLPIAPMEEEQHKIAECLSTLDALIVAQAEKIDALKTHKKGLMQQLLPREGETVPRLRFPEFWDNREWVEYRLDEIASFFKGKGISKADIVVDGKLPCIRYGELYTRYGETIKEVNSHTNVPDKELVLSKANDVIMPASGETQEDIATASCVKESGIALGGDLNIIRSKHDGVFLSYYLNSAKKREIAQMAQGISVIHLYANQLKKLKVNLPGISEQQKIADCLSSLDALISSYLEKHDALKTHKKGLMRQLFPSPEVVDV